jgi:hypothetical protein
MASAWRDTARYGAPRIAWDKKTPLHLKMGRQLYACQEGKADDRYGEHERKKFE